MKLCGMFVCLALHRFCEEPVSVTFHRPKMNFFLGIHKVIGILQQYNDHSSLNRLYQIPFIALKKIDFKVFRGLLDFGTYMHSDFIRIG
jgi:hypothetical protein